MISRGEGLLNPKDTENILKEFCRELRCAIGRQNVRLAVMVHPFGAKGFRDLTGANSTKGVELGHLGESIRDEQDVLVPGPGTI